MRVQSSLDEHYEIELRCVKVRQPLGEFYIAAIESSELIQITYSDVREMVDRDLDRYLGIQREVDKKRVQDISRYVNTVDACFPTAVILAVEGRCAEYDDERGVIRLKTDLKPVDDSMSPITKLQIAKVLDGQHRIEGLRDLGQENRPFDVNVSIFVEMDVESQAYLFSKVNLAQTKVKKSLVYDLFDYANSRSPQKSCHNIAVALDSAESSPFYKRIKRLGVATDGRFGETLTQATFVESLIGYLSDDPVSDRDIYLRGKKPERASSTESERVIFRNMFLDEKDIEIGVILFNYFGAVAERWPNSWGSGARGDILNRTNGFKALMRLLRYVYLEVGGYGSVPGKEQFLHKFRQSNIEDGSFTSDTYKPGAGGESKLFYELAHSLDLVESGR